MKKILILVLCFNCFCGFSQIKSIVNQEAIDIKQSSISDIIGTEQLLSKLAGQKNSSAKEYYDGEAENCKAKSRIECVDEISVSNNFDLVAFDKFIVSLDPQRIRDIFLKNNMEEFLGDFMNLPNSKEIIQLLKQGKLTFTKIPNRKNLYMYQLGTTDGVKSKTNTVKIVFSKKLERTEHVTLLK